MATENPRVKLEPVVDIMYFFVRIMILPIFTPPPKKNENERDHIKFE